MVAVALHQFGPLGQEVTCRQVAVHVDAPRGTLAPSEVAQAVGPVVIALLETLLVQTCTVEAHSLGQLDVVTQGLVRGGCPDAVGVETLVEYKALVVRLVVQVEIPARHMHLAHTGIRLNTVDDHAGGIAHLVGDIVEEGRFWRP